MIPPLEKLSLRSGSNNGMTELMMLDHPAVYNHTDDNREQRAEPRSDIPPDATLCQVCSIHRLQRYYKKQKKQDYLTHFFLIFCKFVI